MVAVCSELCRQGFLGRQLKGLTRKTGQRTQKAVLLKCVFAHPPPKTPPSQLSYQHQHPGFREVVLLCPAYGDHSTLCFPSSKNVNPEVTKSSALLVPTALHLRRVEEPLAGWLGLSSRNRPVEAEEKTWAQWETKGSTQMV